MTTLACLLETTDGINKMKPNSHKVQLMNYQCPDKKIKYDLNIALNKE